jgi:hypothetical protein
MQRTRNLSNMMCYVAAHAQSGLKNGCIGLDRALSMRSRRRWVMLDNGLAEAMCHLSLC